MSVSMNTNISLLLLRASPDRKELLHVQVWQLFWGAVCSPQCIQSVCYFMWMATVCTDCHCGLLLLSFLVSMAFSSNWARPALISAVPTWSVSYCHFPDASGYVTLVGIIVRTLLEKTGCHLPHTYRLDHWGITLVFWGLVRNSHKNTLINEGSFIKHQVNIFQSLSAL